jgi:hypothetical protein
MRNILIATTLIGLSIAPAFAQSGNYCPKVSRGEMIPIETIQQKVKEMGYEVRRVRFDDGCYKVYITEKTTGGEVETYYDPATGELVRAKLGR